MKPSGIKNVDIGRVSLNMTSVWSSVLLPGQRFKEKNNKKRRRRCICIPGYHWLICLKEGANKSPQRAAGCQVLRWWTARGRGIMMRITGFVFVQNITALSLKLACVCIILKKLRNTLESLWFWSFLSQHFSDFQSSLTPKASSCTVQLRFERRKDGQYIETHTSH